MLALRAHFHSSLSSWAQHLCVHVCKRVCVCISICACVRSWGNARGRETDKKKCNPMDGRTDKRDKHSLTNTKLHETNTVWQKDRYKRQTQSGRQKDNTQRWEEMAATGKHCFLILFSTLQSPGSLHYYPLCVESLCRARKIRVSKLRS